MRVSGIAGGAAVTGGSGSGVGAGSASTTGRSGSAVAATVTGFAVLTRRGGGRAGAAGFAGSGALFAGPAPFFALTGGVSAKISPLGSEILR